MAWKWKLAQWAELKWWKNYFSGKDKHEYYQWKSGYWNGLLDKITAYHSLSQNEFLIDAGCGPAGMFIVLDRTKNKVLAFDPLLDNYSKNLDFFDRKDYPNTEFQNCGIEQFSSDEKADVIYCMNAINHVADIDWSYENLINQLKPGGIIVVTIDAHNHQSLKSIFRKLPGDILHPHQYDLKEYANFLEKNNCEIIYEEKLKKEFFFDHYITVARKR